MSTETLNSLSNASSSYLRSAMHQPIRWHEWGEAAFATAKKEDKPILLDIGAVWCHWCHVMDRESYDDPEMAQLVNERFVAIKVDRDERPDIDSRYQVAVQAISGQGGWPLTAFLTPDGKPFYGGTYFPPDEHYGRPSFRRVLTSISEAYREKNGDVVEQAKLVEGAIAHSESFTGKTGEFSSKVIQEIIDSALKMFDEQYGGFGSAPKFPHPSMLDLLIDQYARSGDTRLRQIFTTTLEQMARGGVYDQLAGGFHRYSVDERWIVPHFEKMSYDNSELLKNYLHAWQVTQNSFLRETAESIIGWVNDVLSDQRSGGFYASQDADYCLSDDGDYFTWTLEEVREVLLPDEARIIELYYDVETHGEMHHNPAKNVLWVARDPAAIAKTLGSDETNVRLTIARARGKMLAGRLRRTTPYVDTTMYVAWNAMFVSAYLEAARILGGSIGDRCREFALKTVDRMLQEAWSEDKGFAHRIGGPRLDGSLDDQVFGVIALLDAYETTLNPRYFRAARRTLDHILEYYADAEGGAFFDRPSNAPPLGGLDVRRKPFQDSPTPGANSAAIIALVRVHAYTEDKRYYNFAQKTLEAFARIAPQYGLFAATYGLAALLFARHPIQVVITGRADDPAALSLEAAANRVYRLGKSVLRFSPTGNAGAPLQELPEALRDTLPHLQADRAVAVVCAGQSCLPPTNDPAQLAAMLENGAAGAATK